MQNLEGPLWKDLTERREIFLPAGKARFLPIHVEDIGSAASQILLQTHSFSGQALDLTGSEKLSFSEMATILSEELGKTIRYRSPDPWSFFRRKRKEGLSWDFALVQYMLHFLPRISAEPELSGKVEEITGRPPRSFRTYARELSVRWPVLKQAHSQ
jgi:nucleoside-diphosphate-sugar epimerase